mmetsp:Transcript_12895/g.35140  ORF Transcript_12895/g.35140 Transcript_12895/m.35140 type:complete len:252 (-) Transcript_12895:645-1400(-)
MGSRPCSSAIRSEGLQEWNAPEHMKRMWSVLTFPCFVWTVDPSMIGSRSRCTPSELGSPVLKEVERLLTILSISSMKTIPSCSARRMASLLTNSAGNMLSASTSSICALASDTGKRRFSLRPWPPIRRSRLMIMGLCSPGFILPMSKLGGLFGISTSTILSSSSPERKRACRSSKLGGNWSKAKLVVAQALNSASASAVSIMAELWDSNFSSWTSTAAQMSACACSLSLLRTSEMEDSKRSLMMESTSLPW